MRQKLSKNTLENLSLLMRATEGDGVYVQHWNIAEGRIKVSIRTKDGYRYVTLKGHAIHCILLRLWREAQNELTQKLRNDLKSLIGILGMEE